MANSHGGYRRPTNPASVSGPGRLSRRTDGKQPHLTPTGLPYGDAKALHAQEAVAPMPQDGAPPTPNIPAPQQQAAPAPQFTGAGLMAPTERPDEPITHGVDIGPGAGSEIMPVGPQNPMPDGYITNLLSALSATDTTGTAAQLLISARQRGA